MKIGVNARFLTKPYTGIGQHTLHLFQTLAQQYPDLQLVMVAPERVAVPMPANVQIHLLPETFPGTAGMKKTYWEQRQVPGFLLQQGCDLLHFPYPANPWRRIGQPVCVTVHDTIPWTMPAYRRSLLTRLYQDRCQKALTKADHIFTVSHESKKELQQLYSIADEKISLSYNAPAPLFSQSVSAEKKEAVLRKYQLDKNRRFFLYVGGYDERKNVGTLVETFLAKIAPEFAVDLVLAGGKSLPDKLYKSFDAAASLTGLKNEGTLRLKGKVVKVGFVAEEDLPALYQSSFTFLNLSEKEGCNLPVLEAATAHVPAIVSDLPVHHEMIGDAALFCPPHDRLKLAELMEKMLMDGLFYQQQSAKIKNFVCPFTWQKTAEAVMEVYEQLVS